MRKKSLTAFLCDYFDIGNIPDASQNGLQVDCRKDEIRRIAFAVDASLESISAAAGRGADMLFVHHGLFWSHPLTITGAHYARISALIRNGIALFAVHLPLDAHKEVGNNAVMAKTLGLAEVKGFDPRNGVAIGCIGVSREGLDIERCASILGFDRENDMKCLNFGKKVNKTIAIVSGAAADDVERAAEAGADLFISGEHSHIAFHAAKESGINMLLGGHYKSEVFGVKAAAAMLGERFPDLECFFIDIPTGM